MQRIRQVTIAAALAATAAPAAADPLWDAELRLGYGVELVGGDNMNSAHAAPLTLEGIGAYAFNDSPWLYGYGGFVVEAVDRNSLGATAGVQIVSGKLRARVGGVYLFAPSSLYGLDASAGGCHRMSASLRVCADLDLTEYIAGKDLANGHAVTQVQLVIGMVIDGT